MNLGSTLSNIWHRFQGELLPGLAQEVDPLLETHKRFGTHPLSQTTQQLSPGLLPSAPNRDRFRLQGQDTGWG